VPNADFVVPVEIDGQVHQVGGKDILCFLLVLTSAFSSSASSSLSGKQINEKLGGIQWINVMFLFFFVRSM
jgi:hypothetical protein